MLHIKTFLKASPVDGIGIFAAENIKRGQKIYTPSEKFDIEISNKEFKSLDKNTKYYISHYGGHNYHTKGWHLPFDNMRFMNHSKQPNVGIVGKELIVIALRKIKAGEELLQDFNDFENPLREELR